MISMPCCRVVYIQILTLILTRSHFCHGGGAFLLGTIFYNIIILMPRALAVMFILQRCGIINTMHLSDIDFVFLVNGGEMAW